MNSLPEAPKTGLPHRVVGALIPAIKAKISGGMVAGRFVVATGFGPDEWFRRLFATLHLPEYLSAALKVFDPRIALVGVGIVLIGIDVVLRHYRHQAADSSGSTSELSGSEASAITLSKADASVRIAERTTGLPLPDKPSIAVLPFENLSGDPEQEYFCDGIVDDITTALSHIRWLFVIARDSSYTYKNRTVDIRQAGRELGVRYVLRGSVRKIDSRVRISGQLVEASTGRNIWAEQFDAEYHDIFDLQDRVTSSVAAAVEPNLHNREIERAIRTPTADLTAYDCFLRAQPHFRAPNHEEYAKAERFLRQAIDIDPYYSLAIAYLADIITRQCLAGTRQVQEGIPEAAQLAQRAVDADPEDSSALAVASWVNGAFLGRRTVAAEYAERALKLHPNSAFVCLNCGSALLFGSQIEKARHLFEKGLRINPLDPRRYFVFLGLAMCDFFERKFEESLKWTNRHNELAPSARIGLRFQAAALAHLGRLDEAHEAIAVLKTLTPFLTLAEISSLIPGRDKEMTELVIDGLMLAGYEK